MYVLIGVGCLECEIDSEVIGLFDTAEEAEKVGKNHPDYNGLSFYKLEVSQYQLRIFEIPK